MAVVLYVNDERIDPEALEQEFLAIKAHYESLGKSSCCERDPEFRGFARDNLVARALIHQESVRRGVEISEADVDESLEKLEAEHGGREAFLNNIGAHPCEIDGVRRDIAAGLRVERTLRQAIGGEVDPSPEEVRQFHESHLADYMTEEMASAIHLYKKVDRIEDRQMIFDRMRELRCRALAGEDFHALAVGHTDKEDKQVDLGWFRQNDFMDEFSVIAFSMTEGEISPVFASYFGFHLAKCTGRRPPVPRPFDEVRDEVRARLITEDQQARSKAFVEQLKSVARITERDEE